MSVSHVFMDTFQNAGLMFPCGDFSNNGVEGPFLFLFPNALHSLANNSVTVSVKVPPVGLVYLLLNFLRCCIMLCAQTFLFFLSILQKCTEPISVCTVPYSLIQTQSLPFKPSKMLFKA